MKYHHCRILHTTPSPALSLLPFSPFFLPLPALFPTCLSSCFTSPSALYSIRFPYFFRSPSFFSASDSFFIISFLSSFLFSLVSFILQYIPLFPPFLSFLSFLPSLPPSFLSSSLCVFPFLCIFLPLRFPLPFYLSFLPFFSRFASYLLTQLTDPSGSSWICTVRMEKPAIWGGGGVLGIFSQLTPSLVRLLHSDPPPPNLFLLSVISCLFPVVCYLMSVPYCLLSHVCSLLSVISCLFLLSVISCLFLLSVISCLFPIVCYLMSVPYCLLSHVCSLLSVISFLFRG